MWTTKSALRLQRPSSKLRLNPAPQREGNEAVSKRSVSAAFPSSSGASHPGTVHKSRGLVDLRGGEEEDREQNYHMGANAHSSCRCWTSRSEIGSAARGGTGCTSAA